jgi:hypothetical protein
MFNLSSHSPPSRRHIAVTFRRLGWLGFGCQLFLGLIPLMVGAFQWFFSLSNSSMGVPNSRNIWAFIDILTLIFTIYWCFRYTRLASKLESANQPPSKVSVIREVWVGIIANVGVIFLAALIGMVTVGGLLYIILSLPQGGAAILQPTPGGKAINPGTIIVPMDMLGLLAVMNVILAGLVGVIVSLWLLYRLSGLKH